MSYQKFLVGRVYLAKLVNQRGLGVFMCPLHIDKGRMFARFYVFKDDAIVGHSVCRLMVLPGRLCDVAICKEFLSLASGVCVFDESCIMEAINETKA